MCHWGKELVRGNPEPHTDGYIWVCLLCPNFTSPNFVMVGEAGRAWQAVERAGFEEWHVVFAHWIKLPLYWLKVI